MGRRVFGTIWLAAAVVVGLLLGFAAGLLTPSLRAPGDASAEAGFARDMSSHHAQAVEIAMLAWRATDDPDVRSMSYDIATSQQFEMGVMSRWLEEWRLSPNTTQPRMAWMPDGAGAVRNGLMPGMATKDEIVKLAESKGHATDVLFAQYMLRHHLGGIHMIESVLEQSSRPEVVELATRMKRAQQADMEALRTLLKKYDVQPL